MKLHCLKGDHKAAKVIALLSHISLEQTTQIIYLDPETYLEDFNFQRLSPHGKSPVLETEFGPLYETNTIIRFLVKSQEDRSMLGKSARDEALVDQWLEYIANDLDSILQILYFPYINLMDFDDRQEEALENLKEELAHIEEKVSKGKYLVGFSMTIADLTLAVSLTCPFKSIFDKYFAREFPRLSDWLEDKFKYFSLTKIPLYFRILTVNVSEYISSGISQGSRNRALSPSLYDNGSINRKESSEVESLKLEVSELKEKTLRLENQMQKFIGIVNKLMGEKAQGRRSPSPTKYSEITHSRSSSIRSFQKQDHMENHIQRTKNQRKSTISQKNSRRENMKNLSNYRVPQSDPTRLKFQDRAFKDKNNEMETSRFENVGHQKNQNHRLTFANDQDQVKIDESHSQLDVRMIRQSKETEVQIRHNERMSNIYEKENHPYSKKSSSKKMYQENPSTPNHQKYPLASPSQNRRSVIEGSVLDTHAKTPKAALERDSISINNGGNTLKHPTRSYQMDFTPKTFNSNGKPCRNSSSIPRVKESVKNIFQADETPTITQQSSQKSFTKTNHRQVHQPEMTEENYPSFSQASQIYDNKENLKNSPRIMKSSEVKKSYPPMNQDQNGPKVKTCMAQPIIAQSYKTIDMNLLNLRAKINTAESEKKKEQIVEEFKGNFPGKDFFEISLTREGLDSSLILIDQVLRLLSKGMLTANVCQFEGKGYVVSGVVYLGQEDLGILDDSLFRIAKLNLMDLGVEKRILAALTHVMRTPNVNF
jgi:glutathione S-transferase